MDSASATGTAAVFSVAVCFRRASPFLTGRTTRFFPKTPTVDTIAEVVSAVSGTQSRPHGNHGLQVSLLSTRRGPVQSENLSSGTSGDRNRLREDGVYHDVNTLPALTDYHERPRRASATRRVTAGGRTGLFAESQSPVETVGGRLFSTGRGSYDKAGYVGMGWTVWSVMASLWVDAPTPPCPTPPAAHQLGRADKHETVSREGSGITFL